MPFRGLDEARNQALLAYIRSLHAKPPGPVHPRPQQQSQNQQRKPAPNPFLPAMAVPAAVTVPPPRSNLCGKLPQKAAGTPSADFSSWGPTAAIVASVVARVNAVLTPLGPRGYQVLTSDTFDALWSMTPDNMEAVRAQILAQISERIGKYRDLRGKIPSAPYYELCPIVDELLPTTSDTVKFQAIHDVAEMRYREAILDAIGLVPLHSRYA